MSLPASRRRECDGSAQTPTNDPGGPDPAGQDHHMPAVGWRPVRRRAGFHPPGGCPSTCIAEYLWLGLRGIQRNYRQRPIDRSLRPAGSNEKTPAGIALPASKRRKCDGSAQTPAAHRGGPDPSGQDHHTSVVGSGASPETGGVRRRAGFRPPGGCPSRFVSRECLRLRLRGMQRDYRQHPIDRSLRHTGSNGNAGRNPPAGVQEERVRCKRSRR